MSKNAPNPLGDQSVSRQLEAWAAELDAIVAKLSRTVIEVREFQDRKGTTDDGPEPGVADPGGR